MKNLMLALSLLLFTGCSSFRGDWKRSLEAGVPTTGIEGPWTGTWKSEASGHTDKLRCVISKNPEGYAANFHAKYRHVLSFSYTVNLSVTNQSGSNQYDFSGEANLGKLAGGQYTYKGSATPTNFFSKYDSKYDHGTFQMIRPR